MPRTPGTTSVCIVVTNDNRDQIAEYAAQKGYRIVSDYLRSLIEEDMRANGVKIDLSVDRGGYRIKGSGNRREDESEE